MRQALFFAAAMLTVAATACSGGSGTDRNVAVRDQIEAVGADPDGELTYEHFFYFAAEDGLRAAEAELGDGFVAEVLEPDDDYPEWVLIATQTAALDAATLDSLTARLDELARRHGGDYDGWGVALQP